MEVLKVPAMVAVALGALLLLLGLWLLLRRWLFSRRAKAVPGTVIACRELDTRTGDGTFVPTVRYMGAHGQPVEYTPSVATNYARYAVGETVSVLVDPRDPGNVRIGRAGSFRVWVGPVVMIVVGLGFAAIGFFLSLLAGGHGLDLFRWLFA
jgi:hypothetical protein